MLNTVTVVIQKSLRANSLVVHTDKLKIYLCDIPSTWLTGEGGGSENESPGTLVRTESSGTRVTVTLDGADNLVPRVQIGPTDREPNLLNGSEDESSLPSALSPSDRDRPPRQRRSPVYLMDYLHKLTCAVRCRPEMLPTNASSADRSPKDQNRLLGVTCASIGTL